MDKSSQKLVFSTESASLCHRCSGVNAGLEKEKRHRREVLVPTFLKAMRIHWQQPLMTRLNSREILLKSPKSLWTRYHRRRGLALLSLFGRSLIYKRWIQMDMSRLEKCWAQANKVTQPASPTSSKPKLPYNRAPVAPIPKIVPIPISEKHNGMQSTLLLATDRNRELEMHSLQWGSWMNRSRKRLETKIQCWRIKWSINTMTPTNRLFS